MRISEANKSNEKQRENQRKLNKIKQTDKDCQSSKKLLFTPLRKLLTEDQLNFERIQVNSRNRSALIASCTQILINDDKDIRKHPEVFKFFLALVSDDGKMIKNLADKFLSNKDYKPEGFENTIQHWLDKSISLPDALSFTSGCPIQNLLSLWCSKLKIGKKTRTPVSNYKIYSTVGKFRRL